MVTVLFSLKMVLHCLLRCFLSCIASDEKSAIIHTTFFFLTVIMLLYSGCLQDLLSSWCFHPFDCDVFLCDFLSNYSAWNLLSFFEYVSLYFSQNLEKFWPLSDIFLSHYLQLYITRPFVIVLWISEALFIILKIVFYFFWFLLLLKTSSLSIKL